MTTRKTKTRKDTKSRAAKVDELASKRERAQREGMVKKRERVTGSEPANGAGNRQGNTASKKTKPEEQGEEAEPVRDSKGRFLPGKSGNPTGGKQPRRPVNITVSNRGRKPKQKAPVSAAKKGDRRNPSGLRKGGRPKRKRADNIFRKLRATLMKHAPTLMDQLIARGLKGDKEIQRWVAEQAMRQSIPWQFKTTMETLEDLATEERALAKALAELKIGEGHAKAIGESIDRIRSRVEAQAAQGTRSDFENQSLALRLIQSDPVARKAARTLSLRFDELQRKAIDAGQLTAEVSHPLVDVARQGTNRPVDES